MGNYFSSKVSERKSSTEKRFEHLEREVDELKKTLKKEGKRTSKQESFPWFLYSLVFIVVLWALGPSILWALGSFIIRFGMTILNLETIETQQEKKIKILEETISEQMVRIPEEAETEQEMWAKIREEVKAKREKKRRILEEKKSGDFMDVLNAWLGKKRMRLIYNASVDGFSGESFHKKCDNKGATVTVITSSEGYVFGGYAAVPWGSSRSYDDYTEDDSGESFLFSLKTPRNAKPAKFPLIKKKKAICNYPTDGPRFGTSAIVCWGDSNINDLSYTNVDDSVYSKGIDLHGSKELSGRKNFRAKEIQVYQVL